MCPSPVQAQRLVVVESSSMRHEAACTAAMTQLADMQQQLTEACVKLHAANASAEQAAMQAAEASAAATEAQLQLELERAQKQNLSFQMTDTSARAIACNDAARSAQLQAAELQLTLADMRRAVETAASADV